MKTRERKTKGKHKHSKKNKNTNRTSTRKKRLYINGKRYPDKNGWIRICIFGNAFERGYAHGMLLSKELANIQEKILPFLVKTFLHISDSKYLNDVRKNLFSIIQNEYPEFFEELQGIAAGASVNHPAITIDFVIAWNAFLSMMNQYSRKTLSDHCSAFIAVGDATEKGDIIMAHNTHSDFVSSATFNVILELIPEKGHGQKIKMQTAPGFIASGSDWFLCENGIIGCETTIGKFRYKPDFSDGVPYFCRIRQAMQYANSLDDFVGYMKNKNAGDYACSWLLGDTRKDRQEIMLLEVGLHIVNVQKKKNGVFYGMNSAISREIREKETTDVFHWDQTNSSGARNIRFHVLMYETYYGKINTTNAKAILSDHYDVSSSEETKGNSLTICRHSNLDPRKGNRGPFFPWGCTDGKVVSSSMARKWSFLGRFGPSCGNAFSAKTFIEKHPKFRGWSAVLPDMPSEPWILL